MYTSVTTTIFHGTTSTSQTCNEAGTITFKRHLERYMERSRGAWAKYWQIGLPQMGHPGHGRHGQIGLRTRFPAA